MSRQSAGTAASRALPEVGRCFRGNTRIRCVGQWSSDWPGGNWFFSGIMLLQEVKDFIEIVRAREQSHWYTDGWDPVEGHQIIDGLMARFVDQVASGQLGGPGAQEVAEQLAILNALPGEMDLTMWYS